MSGIIFLQEEKKEVDPKQAKRDKEKIDRLIAEQAEEQRLGHKLYKGEMGGPEAEKKKKGESFLIHIKYENWRSNKM